MTTTPDDARALADKLVAHADRVRVALDMPEAVTVMDHAASALGDLADAAQERDALKAAGRDLVALVEHLAAEHVDPATMTPVMLRIVRARLNRHRDTLGLPRPDYAQPDQVDANAALGEGDRA